MFNIGMAELVVILLVAFLVVGPKDLPKVARWIAREIKKLRRLLKELKKEVGWDELSSQWNDAKGTVDGTLQDMDVTAELRRTENDIQQAMDELQDDVQQAAKSIQEQMTGGEHT